MTVSFLYGANFGEYGEYFQNGRSFMGYTTYGNEVIIKIVDRQTLKCSINGMLCIFDPLTWNLFRTDFSVFCTLQEIIPI